MAALIVLGAVAQYLISRQKNGHKTEPVEFSSVAQLETRVGRLEGRVNLHIEEQREKI